MKTRLFHWDFLLGITLTRKLNEQIRSTIHLKGQIPHLLQERVREGLYTELEGAEVRRFIQPLHLFCHERLVNRLPLRVCRFHCTKIDQYPNSNSYDSRLKRTVRADRVKELEEDALNFGTILLWDFVCMSRG